MAGLEEFLFYEGMDPEFYTPLTGMNVNKLARFLYTELELAMGRISSIESRINEDVKIGDLFITTLEFENPNAVRLHKGYGLWVKFGDGHALVTRSVNSNSPSWTKGIQNTFGEYEHKLTTPELPKFANSNIRVQTYSWKYGPGKRADEGFIPNWAGGSGATVGDDQPHNNVQPSIVVDAWLRVPDLGVYNLSASKTTANEGDTVVFTLQTTGVAEGTPLDWVITGIQSDDIEGGILSGQFVIDLTGRATHSVKILEDNKTEGIEIMRMALKYLDASVSVVVADTSKTPTSDLIFYEGNNSLIIPPNQTVTFHIYGPGGAGGGSIYSADGSAALPNGTSAGDSEVHFLDTELIAGGGEGGTGGIWTSGSDYVFGTPGSGGVYTVTDPSGNLESVVPRRGIDAIVYDRYAPQLGAEGLSSIIGKLNKGGNGAYADAEIKAFGGAAGSGAGIVAVYTNLSPSNITANISVGPSGKGWKASGNAGTDGGPGYVVVEKVDRPIYSSMRSKANVEAGGQVLIGVDKGTCRIDWGDGTISNRVSGNVSHTYTNAGEYTISMKKDSFETGTGGRNTMSIGHMINITEVIQWWSGGYESLTFSKLGDADPINNDTLVKVPTNAPLIQQVMIDSGTNPLFKNCTKFNDPSILSWITSSWRSMFEFFKGCSLFNQPVSAEWDFYSVKRLKGFLENCVKFNQPWTTLNASSIIDPVEELSFMFNGCTELNQDYSLWCVSELIESPASFATGTAMDPAKLPVWGTCPAGFRLGSVQDVTMWSLETDRGSYITYEAGYNFSEPLVVGDDSYGDQSVLWSFSDLLLVWDTSPLRSMLNDYSRINFEFDFNDGSTVVIYYEYYRDFEGQRQYKNNQHPSMDGFYNKIKPKNGLPAKLTISLIE